ncbi:E3 ubiquitin-protein ligase TRIM35 [Misgurnus anguillicaudatus]|uniref:E3 ubiquitin-protein ligase TRIM35 n=1 Tax=Misgurnus anguillicaudatus TaxID=75329 RepID=UPI003CCF4F94
MVCYIDSRPVGGAPSKRLQRRAINQKKKTSPSFLGGQFDQLRTVCNPSVNSLKKLLREMATKRHFAEEDFCCSVCRSVYSDPVLLPCGHSGCKECIQKYWATRASRHCPICRKVSVNNPPLNLALRNLCQSFLDYKRDLEEMCEAHQQKFSGFCCDDKTLVCDKCKDSDEHKNHTCRPIREVAEEHRGVYRSQLNLLKAKLILLKRRHCYGKAEDIERSANFRENLIRNEFRQLRQLLDNEESLLIEELLQEKKVKLQIMKDKVKKTSQDTISLSSTIKDLEERINSVDITLLQTLKETAMILKYTPQDPAVTTGELIDCAKYLGNLKFNVWKTIGAAISYTPVVLDPNTANSLLQLSDDLTEVWNPNEALDDDEYPICVPVPANLERFQNWPCVLGSVGFSTGVHSWDVEVKDNKLWSVGVAIESVQRKGKYGEPGDVWCIGFDGKYFRVKDPLGQRILCEYERPKQVRVKLDLIERQVSFSDPQSNAVYHTFTPIFTEKVFPYFHTECCKPPLRILPGVNPFIK